MNKKTKTPVAKTTEKVQAKWFSFMKLYLMLVSVWAIIGTAVCLWILLYQTLSMKIITDEEYIQMQWYYEIDACMNPPYNYNYWKETMMATAAVTWDTTTRSDADIEKCKTDKRTNLIIRRSANFKDTLLWAVAWGSVFLLLFLTHFPFFIKRDRK